MEFELTKEQKLLKASAKDFLKKECPVSLMREMRDNLTGFPDNIWRKMADLGWLGIMIPEEYEGVGGSFVDLVILLEAMGEVCCSGPFFSSVVLAGLTICEAGSEKQKKELLPALANGDMIFSLALTEPGNWYSHEIINTKLTDTGDGYLLNGTKLFVENAGISDFLLCVAKDESADNDLSIILVDPKSPGIEITGLDTLAYDKQCEVVFNDVRVPKENIIGSSGKALQVINKLVEFAAIAKSAELLGVLQATFDMTLSYAKQRKQFGQPIGSFQAIQHYFANMIIDVDGARLLTYQASWKISENQSATMETSMAKAWISDAASRVSSLGHQIHGSIAFCDEHDMHFYYRKAKACEVAFGNSNYHLEKVAAELGL